MIKNFCKICGNFFERPFRKGTNFRISWVNYRKRRFCSNRCRAKWLSQTIIGSKNPNWRGGKKCIDCGKEIGRTRMATLRCRQCYVAWLKSDPSHHPNWKGGNPKCSICGNQTGDYYSKICRKCAIGENHWGWKGDKVGYDALHYWVKKYLGKPSECSLCGKKAEKHFYLRKGVERRYRWSIEWANKSGKYKRDLSDWIALCTSCHTKYDKHLYSLNL